MLSRLKISDKIALLLLVLTTASIFFFCAISYNFSKQSIEEQYAKNIRTQAEANVIKVESFLAQKISGLDAIASQPKIQQDLSALLSATDADIDSLLDLYRTEISHLANPFVSAYGFNQLVIIDKGQRSLFSSSEIDFSSQFESLQEVSGGEGILLLSNIQLDTSIFYLGRKILNDGGVTVGTLITSLNTEDIAKLFSNDPRANLAIQTSETELMLLNLESNSARRIAIGDERNYAAQQAISGSKGTRYDLDADGSKMLSSWQSVKPVNWGLATSIPASTISKSINGLLKNYVITGVIILWLALMIAFIFSRMLINPLASIGSSLKLLGKGVLPKKLTAKNNDEIGTMASALNNLVGSLEGTADFATKIGQGNFDAQFKPMSNQDKLGNALINMRDSIQQAEIDDKERNWIVTGMAEVGDILRSHTEIESLGDEIISYITNKIDAIQGAFYITEEERGEKLLQMKSVYAYNKKKYLNGSYRFAEGLVGQAAVEKDTVLRTEIPSDYVTISSGILGDQKPTSILISPLITNEEVYGAMEFAGFQEFDTAKLKFVEELSQIIARTIFNIKVNETTKKHLEESQQMSNELRIQQDELRHNAEEMEATQEELKRTNHRLEEQVEEVNRGQKRMQLLLENASEVITIYEHDQTIRYISPSVDRILGYTQNDLMGQKILQSGSGSKVPEIWEMFEGLRENPSESYKTQFIYEKKDKSTIWLEATGTNLLDDPAIHGYVVNFRDITEQKRAEQEERMRTKMQALSENSPDLITRIDDKGTFFYINPVIEHYTGNKPEHYLNQQIGQVDLNEKVTEQWATVLSSVLKQKDKQDMEMDFPSTMGDRIMQVNAIPEFNEDEKIESILLVSHDITERKLIELEVQTKNKKITESINYAKRIQGAILPNTNVIRQVLPNSFILYKAKDVVSGDFPWFLQVGDTTYMAAVDCTGHGVPGALISLIGYFLLNDIVRSREVTDPGVILDLLDDGVTKTLRQDSEDSKTKDGMDIALCKINKEHTLVEYAGAHRPLYIVKDEELQEIKGNKFAIGGGRYKNQTNFTNHQIPVKPGDSVYFCSDGFPDQFGGPDDRKFGPKRTRALIAEHQAKPIKKMEEILSKEWNDWMGDARQTDDMLMIGIKF